MSEKRLVEPTITMTKDEGWIPQLVELSQKVNPDLAPCDFEAWLEENLAKQELLLIVICDGEDLVGYLLARAPHLLDDAAFIYHAYLDSKYYKSGLQEKVLKVVEAWAKRWGASSLKAEVKKNLNAWEKRYNFKVSSVIVERKI